MSSVVEYLESLPIEFICDENAKISDYDDLAVYERDEEIFKTVHNLLMDEFPNAPFSICLPYCELIKLDKPFSNEKVVVIHDDRASHTNYYYKDVPLSDINQFRDYLVIKQKNNKCITLRDVLHEMIQSPHYNHSIISKDPHCFLEAFFQTSPIQYNPFFGS